MGCGIREEMGDKGRAGMAEENLQMRAERGRELRGKGGEAG